MPPQRGRALLTLACLTLLLAPWPQAGVDAATTVTAFSDGSPARSVLFGPGGGWNNTTFVTLPRGVTVMAANLTLTAGGGQETGRHAANGSAAAGAASSIENLTVQGDNLTLAGGEWWWGQDAAGGFGGSALTDAVAAPDGVRLERQNGWRWLNLSLQPGKRAEHAATWEPDGGRLYLFGGWNGNSRIKDTWAYDPWNDSWRRLSDGPSPRSAHSAVWDTQNDQMLVFGGYTDSGQVNELWAYRPAQDRWVSLKAGATARGDHTAVWDDRNKRMLVFGGYNTTLSSALDDLWMYYPSNDTWAQGTPGPSKRFDQCSVMADGRSEMLVYGGDDYSQYLNDAWAYNVTTGTWTPYASGPSARGTHGCGWDDVNERMIVYGGQNPSLLSAVWFYEPGSNKWTQHGNDVDRSEFSATWGAAAASLFVFGGNPGPMNGFRLYTQPHRPTGNVTSPALSSGSASYGTLSVNISLPPGTSYSVDVLNATTSAILLSGLRNGDRVTAGPSAPPTVRLRLAITTTSVIATPVLHGWGLGTRLVEPLRQAEAGQTAAGVVVDEGAWVNTTGVPIETTGNWTRLADGASRRMEHTAVWDAHDGRLLVFAGMDIVDTGMYDLWSYNTSKGWVQDTDATGYVGRRQHAAVWDGRNNQMLVFGGRTTISFNSAPRNDLLVYSSSGIWVTKSNGATARTYHTAVWDSLNNRMLVFGGWTDNPPYILNDTWAYIPDANKWENLTPGSGGGPAPRHSHTAVWDSLNNRMLVFGGTNGPTTFNDTWAYSPSTGNWTRMADGPAPRYGHTAVWDARAGRMLVFGGRSSSLINDTWAYNPATNNWTQLPSGATPRYYTAAAWDILNNRMLVFGGDGGGTLNDLWAFTPPSAGAGTMTSPVRDIGPGVATLGPVTINATIPRNGTVSISLRTSPDNSTWSSWETVVVGAALKTPPARYLQWRAGLSVGENGATPVLHSLSLAYSISRATGTLTSRPITATGNITEAAAVLNATLRGGTVSLYLSADGGFHWQAASGGGPVTFAYPGRSLVYRLDFNVSAAGWSPLFHNLSIVYGHESLPSGVIIGAGNYAVPVGDLPAGTRVDMAGALNGYLSDAGPGPGNIDVPLSLFSSTAGTVNLTDLSIAFGTGGIVNNPPAVTLLAPPNGTFINTTAVEFRWDGNDTDGDALSYRILFSDAPFDLAAPPAPAATTNATAYTKSGLVNGTTYYWGIIPYDGMVNGSAGGVWRFTVNLSFVNRPPRITSTPPANAAVGREYTYNITAVDDDGDALSFSLVTPIPGMAVNPSSGKLAWTPKANQTGNHRVKVGAADVWGGLAEQNFTINVSTVPPPSGRPLCTISSPKAGEKAGGTVRVAGTALGAAAAVQKVEVRLDGGAWQAATGTVNWSLILDTAGLGNGYHTITARAFDGALHSENATVEFLVERQAATTVRQPVQLWLIGAVLALAALAAAGIFAARRKRPVRAAPPPPSPQPVAETVWPGPPITALNEPPPPEPSVEPAPSPKIVGDDSPPFRVEQLLLIYRDGRLMASARSPGAGKVDKDIFGGMLTAVQQFVKDSFNDERMNRISFGKKDIHLERGPQMFLASVTVGKVPDSFRRKTRQLVQQIWDDNREVIKHWDGRLNDLAVAESMLKTFLMMV